jgi:pentatricopeptide repeat protein
LPHFPGLPLNAVLCRHPERGYNPFPGVPCPDRSESILGEAPPATPPSDTPSEDRLDSWKEIAVYLNRDVTTVQRWEKREGMPVHRHLHDRMGSVYASRAQLDEWVRGRSLRAAQEGSDNVSAPIVAQPQDAATSIRRSRWRPVLPLAAALVLALAIGASWLAHKRSSKQLASTTAGIRSLVVLPLDNYSGNPDQDYLSDGMTEALIARLSTIQGLRVISRTSAMQLKGTHKSVPAIGKELNVDAVIEGSVLRAGDKIRVTVQLIRTDTDAHLWAGTYDRELQDVLALQSEVTHGIAGHVEAAVSGLPSSTSVAPRAVAPEVYENYLKGRYALNKDNRAELDEALRYFEAAIAADPKFAPAYAGIAETYDELGTVYIGGRPNETRPQTILAARKALELDPDLTEAHVALAAVLERDWHWAEAETEYKRAIELSPSDASAHSGLAGWLLCQGRTEEALAQARRAQELDPLAVDNLQVGWILFQSRRYDEAIRELRTAATLTPDDPGALWYLGFALCGAEQFHEAIRALEKAASLTDRSPGVLGVLVRAYARGGRRTDALRVLDEMKARSQKAYVPPAAFLNAYLGLGDREEAFVWLGHAADERSDILQFLKVHPFFDPLRSDPRFAEYLRRANLAP